MFPNVYFYINVSACYTLRRSIIVALSVIITIKYHVYVCELVFKV